MDMASLIAILLILGPVLVCGRMIALAEWVVWTDHPGGRMAHDGGRGFKAGKAMRIVPNRGISHVDRPLRWAG